MQSPQPLSTSAMTSQTHSTSRRHNSNTKNVTASAREWDRNRFEIYGSALELISNMWMFDSVYIKGNQMKLLAYFIAAYITKERFTVLTKNGGGDHKRWFSRVHYNARWRNDALQTML